MKKNKIILSIVYAVYALLCLPGCLWFEKLYKMAVDLLNTTYDPNCRWLNIVSMLALGMLWGGEHWLARKAEKPVVLVIRILSIAVMVLWSLELLLIFVLPKSLTFVWMSPTFAVPALLGIQLISTVELMLVKKKDAA